MAADEEKAQHNLQYHPEDLEDLLLSRHLPAHPANNNHLV